MRRIARRHAAWVLTTCLAASSSARSADPNTLQLDTTQASPAVEVLPPVHLHMDNPEPASRLIPLYYQPVSPYGPAIPGKHPAITARPVYIGEVAPPPRELGPAMLPLPGNAPAGSLAAPYQIPWATTPPVQQTPAGGMFLVPPTGEGYYSFFDLLLHERRVAPPASAFSAFALQSTSGFDADYRYLESPDNDQRSPLDHLKRMHLTPDTMLTVGGQSSLRYMDEVSSSLTRRDDTYWLLRDRVWADLWYTEWFRVYGEFISALVGNERRPRPFDENQADLLNLFAEIRVCDIADAPAYVRVGRQELLFGSQRLVSTNDWFNTRQTFEGIRGFWRTEELDVDVFAVHPVRIEPTKFDQADTKTLFCGVWTTYRPMPGTSVDLYYLGLRNGSQLPDRFVPGPLAPRGDEYIHTLGARLAGNDGPFMYDLEGMCQEGQRAGRDLKACAFTTAVGWEFAEHPWRPQVWAGYDYASGTKDPVSGDDHTFNQLYGYGHYYLGYLDLVGRQNIEDVNVQLAAFPDRWITLLAQGHHFQLAQAHDFLYDALGRPIRRSASGLASRNVGNEIDLTANLHITANQDVLIGYSKLFAGQFIRETGANVSPELFYAMYNLRW